MSEGETAHISCRVDSYPEADGFAWSFNTSSGGKKVRNALKIVRNALEIQHLEAWADLHSSSFVVSF